MSSINKVILIGRLGSNPELRTMPNGEAVTSISVATNETWIDRISGEKKNRQNGIAVSFSVSKQKLLLTI